MSAWSSDDGENGKNAPPPAAVRPDRAAGDGEVADEACLRRIARDRDRGAFAMIFERYGARVKGYMIRAGADPEQAEEAAQEALLAVWRRAETFDPTRASAAAWIFAIARNKRIDLIRRAARFEPREIDDPSQAPESEPPADAALAGAQRDRAVRDALAGLTPEQLAVVRLAFYEGCPHSEIAERLGLPLGTVKSRLRLAFGKLRAALGAEIRDDPWDS